MNRPETPRDWLAWLLCLVALIAPPSVVAGAPKAASAIKARKQASRPTNQPAPGRATELATSPARKPAVGRTPTRPRLYDPSAPALTDGHIEVEGSHFLDRDTYEGLRENALDVLAMVPPEAHFYVGVGRSPTALISYLSELFPDGAVAFPASGLRHGIANEDLAEFDRHIAKIIPKAAFTSGKTLLLMDTVAGGGSLRTMKAALIAYSKRKYGKAVKVELLGLGGQAEGIKYYLPSEAFLQAGRTDIAPYASEHYIGQHTLRDLPAKVNPEHQRFRTALRQRLARDVKLDDFLEAGYQRVLRLDPGLQVVGDIDPLRFCCVGESAARATATRMLKQLAEAHRFKPQPGADAIRLELRWDPNTGHSTLETNLPPELDSALLGYANLAALGELIARPHGYPPWSLSIELPLGRDGRPSKDASLIVTPRYVTGTLRSSLAAVDGELRSVYSARPRSLPTAIAQAQRAVVRAFADTKLSGGQGAKVRLEMSADVLDGMNRYGKFQLAWRSNLPAPVAPRLNEPAFAESLAAVMHGPAGSAPFRLEIEATLDADGMISDPAAVTISRKPQPVRLLTKPKQIFAGNARVDQVYWRNPRALEMARRAITQAFETLTVERADGTSDRIVTLALRTSPTGAGFAFTIDGTLQPADSAAFGDNPLLRNALVELGWPDRSGELPRDVDISLTFDQHGRLAGPESIRIDYLTRPIKLHRAPKKLVAGSYSNPTFRATEGPALAVRKLVYQRLRDTAVPEAAGTELTIDVSAVDAAVPAGYPNINIVSRLPDEMLAPLQDDGEAVGALLGLVPDQVPFDGHIRIKLDSQGRIADASAIEVERRPRKIELRKKVTTTSGWLGYLGSIPTRKQATSRLPALVSKALRRAEFVGLANETLRIAVRLKQEGTWLEVDHRLPDDLVSIITQDPIRGQLAALAGVGSGKPTTDFVIEIALDASGQVSGPGAVTITSAP